MAVDNNNNNNNSDDDDANDDEFIIIGWYNSEVMMTFPGLRWRVSAKDNDDGEGTSYMSLITWYIQHKVTVLCPCRVDN